MPLKKIKVDLASSNLFLFTAALCGYELYIEQGLNPWLVVFLAPVLGMIVEGVFMLVFFCFIALWQELG